MLYLKALLLAALLASCATAPAMPERPPAEQPRTPGAPVVERPLLPVVLPVVSPEMLADAVSGVEAAMELAHGVTWTRDSFKIPTGANNVGQVNWTGDQVVFALNDEMVGSVARDQPCGSETLQVAWRSIPVGHNIATTIEATPNWWRLGDAHVRVGATDLIGVANDTRNNEDCALWGVLIEGPARVDPDVKSPGSSGPTEGTVVDVFGEETNLVVATTGATLGADPPAVQMIPTFEASCVHARWAGDLLGTRTLRVRFTNGPQANGCPTGEITEEFVHAVRPDGELARTQRERREPMRIEREDHVVRNIGVGRLIWNAQTTETRQEGGCDTVVEEVVAKWTLKYPQQPDNTAAARRVRTSTSCEPSAHAESGG